MRTTSREGSSGVAAADDAEITRLDLHERRIGLRLVGVGDGVEMTLVEFGVVLCSGEVVAGAFAGNCYRSLVREAGS